MAAVFDTHRSSASGVIALQRTAIADGATHVLSAIASAVASMAASVSPRAALSAVASGSASLVAVGFVADRLPVESYLSAFLNPPDAGTPTHGTDYLRIGERIARRRGLV